MSGWDLGLVLGGCALVGLVLYLASGLSDARQQITLSRQELDLLWQEVQGDEPGADRPERPRLTALDGEEVDRGER